MRCTSLRDDASIPLWSRWRSVARKSLPGWNLGLWPPPI